jgi:hypothetical protein
MYITTYSHRGTNRPAYTIGDAVGVLEMIKGAQLMKGL